MDKNIKELKIKINELKSQLKSKLKSRSRKQFWTVTNGHRVVGRDVLVGRWIGGEYVAENRYILRNIGCLIR